MNKSDPGEHILGTNDICKNPNIVLHVVKGLDFPFYFFNLFFKNLFIFGCVGSSLLRVGFL